VTLLRVALAIVRRPSLWPVAFAQWRRTVPADWWRRAPFLPLPTAEYLAFRLSTQYGDRGRPPEPADVVHFLTWCRSWDRARR
jgi:hypothetical protein